MNSKIDFKYLFEDAPEMAFPPEHICPIVNMNGDKLIFRCLKPGIETQGEKRPAILILHGFPGNEQLRDLAQEFRRCGFVSCVIFFRGVWGSGGVYRLAQLPQDALAVIQYMREHSDELRIDPDRIYVMGHSMGGFTTMRLLAADADISGAIMLAPCDVSLLYTKHRADYNALITAAEPYFNLGAGIDKSVFSREIEAHKDEWAFASLKDKIKGKTPMLFVGGKRDTTCPPDEHIAPAFEYFESQAYDVKRVILDSDHCFQSVRVALARKIAEWFVGKEV